jgi:TRAP-type mannitol/chloroaromatic compound transport system substrate-binding protein
VITGRRRFIARAGGVVATVAAVSVVDAPNVIAQPKIHWRMSTTWTTTLDVLQGSAERLAKVVEEMSGGRFRIEVFAGGQIMGLMARKVQASFTKFQALVGPWDHVADSAYHQFVAS